MIDGKQYVSVAVGWGGVFGIAVRVTEYAEPGHGLHLRGRRQGAAAGLREIPDRGLLAGVKYDPKDVPEGTAIYVAACVQCHGVPGVDNGGNVRNLGYVPKETIANLKDFVFKGPFRDQGMPDFTGKLTEADVVKIQAFIQGTADAIRPKSRRHPRDRRIAESGRAASRTDRRPQTKGLRETIAQPFVVSSRAFASSR